MTKEPIPLNSVWGTRKDKKPTTLTSREKTGKDKESGKKKRQKKAALDSCESHK